MHEKEVIERIRARDEGGIEALLTHFGPLMRYVIAPILPNDADREECLSECCMKVWDGIERFKPERGSWTAWLTAIARNSALNRARSRRGGHASRIRPQTSPRRRKRCCSPSRRPPCKGP